MVFFLNSHTEEKTQWEHPKTGKRKRVAGGLYIVVLDALSRLEDVTGSEVTGHWVILVRPEWWSTIKDWTHSESQRSFGIWPKEVIRS
jgi:hypothetical protein